MSSGNSNFTPSSGGLNPGSFNYSTPTSTISTYTTTLSHDDLKSNPKESSPSTHILTGILRLYGDCLIVEYSCSHCNKVLHSEVISKVPEGIIKEKCLPRIINGVR